MKESEIRKNYTKLINKLTKHNKNYFEKSAPTISDREYDIIKKEILDLEKKFLFLKSPLSPSGSLGYKPSKNFIKSNMVFKSK